MVANDFFERAGFRATAGAHILYLATAGRAVRRQADAQEANAAIRRALCLSIAPAGSLEIPAQLDVRVSTRANDAVIGESGREVYLHLSDFHVGDMSADSPLIKSLIAQHG